MSYELLFQVLSFIVQVVSFVVDLIPRNKKK